MVVGDDGGVYQNQWIPIRRRIGKRGNRQIRKEETEIGTIKGSNDRERPGLTVRIVKTIKKCLQVSHIVYLPIVL